MQAVLDDLPLDRVNQILLHPLQQDTVGVVTQLITVLRACRSTKDSDSSRTCSRRSSPCKSTGRPRGGS